MRLNACLVGFAFASAAVWPLAGRVPQTAPARSIVVVDSRDPAEDKEHVNLWIGSCDYFITRLTDRGMSQKRLAILQGDLARDATVLADGEQVTVRHYAIYLNDGVFMTAAAVQAGVGGAVGGAIAPGSPRRPSSRCSREKTKNGWFDSSETTNEKAPLIGEAEVEVRGRQFVARYVYSPDRNFNENSNKPIWGDIKIEVLHRLNAALAAQINDAFRAQ